MVEHFAALVYTRLISRPQSKSSIPKFRPPLHIGRSLGTFCTRASNFSWLEFSRVQTFVWRSSPVQPLGQCRLLPFPLAGSYHVSPQRVHSHILFFESYLTSCLSLLPLCAIGLLRLNFGPSSITVSPFCLINPSGSAWLTKKKPCPVFTVTRLSSNKKYLFKRKRKQI